MAEKGTHVVKSYFEWTDISSDHSKEVQTGYPKGKTDVLWCSCGGTEFRLFTVADSAQVKDVSVICIKCAAERDLPFVMGLCHSS